jgi:hypothetical protein
LGVVVDEEHATSLIVGNFPTLKFSAKPSLSTNLVGGDRLARMVALKFRQHKEKTSELFVFGFCNPTNEVCVKRTNQD